jgi:hypothetical protein
MFADIRRPVVGDTEKPEKMVGEECGARRYMRQKIYPPKTIGDRVAVKGEGIRERGRLHLMKNKSRLQGGLTWKTLQCQECEELPPCQGSLDVAYGCYFL